MRIVALQVENLFLQTQSLNCENIAAEKATYDDEFPLNLSQEKPSSRIPMLSSSSTTKRYGSAQTGRKRIRTDVARIQANESDALAIRRRSSRRTPTAKATTAEFGTGSAALYLYLYFQEIANLIHAASDSAAIVADIDL